MAPRPPRIAHVGCKGIPANGGTERVVEALATRHAAIAEVVVYGSRRAVRSGRYRGVEVIALPAVRHKYAGPVLLQFLATAHALWVGRYSVVHVHGTENGFVVPLLRLRYPVVLSSHGTAYELAKWPPTARRLMRLAERLGVRTASVVSAVASPQAELLARRYGVRVEAIPNGVEQDQTADCVAARDILSQHGVPQDGPFILFVAARVDPAKGCHTLVEAHARLKGAVPLVIVGDLAQAPGYEGYLRGAAAGRGVHFLPPTENHAALLGLVKAARVCVFPSTNEAMSIMLLEAMASEGLVITSDIAEMKAVTPPWQPSFSAGDPDDLARVLSAALSLDRDRRADLGRRARIWVEDRFAWSHVAALYEEAYGRALRDGSGRATERGGSGRHTSCKVERYLFSAALGHTRCSSLVVNRIARGFRGGVIRGEPCD